MPREIAVAHRFSVLGRWVAMFGHFEEKVDVLEDKERAHMPVTQHAHGVDIPACPRGGTHWTFYSTESVQRGWET